MRGKEQWTQVELDEPKCGFGFDEPRTLSTQTIDFGTLLAEELSTSGSFDLREVEGTSFGKLFNALPIPVLLVDPSHSIIFANIACSKISPNYRTIEGKAVSSLFPKTYDVMTTETVLDKIFSKRSPQTSEALLEIEKKRIWARLHWRSLRLGKQRSILVMIEDLTLEMKQLLETRKQKEDLEKSQDALEKRVAERTTELNNLNEELKKEIAVRKEVDEKLRQAHEQLEKRVKERTKELEETNVKLKIAIVERQQAEHELRTKERLYRRLVETANDIIYQTDAKGYITYVNPVGLKLTGFSKEEIIGKHYLDFFPAEYRDKAARFYGLQFVKKASETYHEFPIVAKEGDRIWLGQKTHLLTEGDTVVGFQSIARDISARHRAEEALRASEERLRALSEATFEAIFLWEKGICIGQNVTAEKMFGHSGEEAIGRCAAEWIAPDYRDLVLQQILEGYEEPYEAVALRKDGTTFPCEIQGRSLTYEGRLIRVTALRDITERKQTEEALRESEERFRTAFQTSPDSININRMDDGVYIDINEGFTAITGYTREDVIGKSSLQVSIWHDLRDRERMSEGLRKNGYVRNLEAKFRFKDGQVRTGLMSAKVMLLNEVPHILSVTRDIDDWRNTRDALRESEQRLELALTGAGLGLWDWNLRTGKAVLSEGTFSMLGYGPKEAKPDLRTWKRSVHPDDWQHVSKSLNKHLDGSTTIFEVQYRNRTKTGEWKWISARGKVMERDENGNPLRMTGTALDITESKRLEDQLLQAQKMEAIGTLAGGVAHDFNNLLQIVLGFGDLLLMGKSAEDPGYKALQAIRQAACRGRELVQRILTFSRKVETHPRALDLNHEVSRAKELLSRTVPKMISIDLQLADDLQKVYADPGQIELILLNLAVNAKDAMPDGGQLVLETNNVTIDGERSHKHMQLKPGEHVMLRVADNGHGMEKKILDRIFEPFYTTKKSGEGTGLGLAMVFGIVKSHNGHITAQSEPGKGTTFEIYLPAMEAEPHGNVEATREMPAFGIETILLVDDEELIRDLGKQILTQAGYTVLTAENGFKAVEMYQERQDEIALIVLDLIMPEMGGKQCLSELLRINPKAKVLVATGQSLNGATKDDLGAGARGFVKKPYGAKDILHKVREVLDKDCRA